MPELVSRNPWILLVFLALAVVEWVWRTRRTKRGYDLRASAASVGVAIGQFVLKPVTAAFVTAIYLALHEHRLFDLPITDWRVWVAAFIAVEFVYYWFHRFSHTINWFWATHSVHHTPNEMTFPAAIRLGWTGPLSGVWVFFLPLVLIGFSPFMVVGLLGANLIFQYTLHTEAIGKLWRWIEYAFNTPSHHRVHHAANAEYLDKNFGGVVIVFDRMFGTFAEEHDMAALRYGLVTPLRSYNPFRIAFNQWGVMLAALWVAQGWRRRAEVLFGRPAILDSEAAPISTARPARTPAPQA